MDQDMEQDIAQVCNEIKALLIEKNKAYGNSVANPVGVFSKCDPMEQINVRIDDKLSRIARGKEFAGDDTELDLIGYLILKRVIRKIGQQPQPHDPAGILIDNQQTFTGCDQN